MCWTLYLHNIYSMKTLTNDFINKGWLSTMLKPFTSHGIISHVILINNCGLIVEPFVHNSHKFLRKCFYWDHIEIPLMLVTCYYFFFFSNKCVTRLLKSGFYLESLGGFRESNRRIES